MYPFQIGFFHFILGNLTGQKPYKCEKWQSLQLVFTAYSTRDNTHYRAVVVQLWRLR